MKPDAQDFLARVAEACERAATGDLEARILGTPESGDLHRIGVSINRLLDIADAYVRESGAAMDHCARGQFHRPVLTRGLAGAYAGASRTLNGAARKMRDDATNLAAFEAERRRMSEELAGTTQAVAAACEQLNATTTQLSGQVGQAAEISRRSVDEAGQAQRAIAALAEAAKKIESVTDLISRIARQTTLLALNAQIEAARAGAAGAGFGVVANEVKELSGNTTRATKDIGTIVESMIEATTQVSAAVGAIGTSVQEVDSSASTMRRSLHEQTQATREIADRIAGVAEQARALSEGGDVLRAA